MADNTDDLIISISTDQATLRRSIKRIEQDLAGLAGNVQKQFTNVGKSIDNSVSSTMQNRINAMVGIGTKAANEWTGALADQGKELDRLRAKYSPLFNTINNYKTAVSDIRRAHAIGAISANEMAAAISRERQAALASTAAIKGRNAALADRPVQSGGGSFQTANIAAQFQDIAVTSAMGMNPLQIALQQGTQLSSVIQTMGNGRGIVTGLAAAFTSLVSPVSLVTIGLVAGGAAAIQYFSSIASGSDKSEEALKKEEELIQRVATKWAEALPELKKYADERQKLADGKEIKDAAAAEASKQWEDLRAKIKDVNIEFADTIDLINRSSDETGDIVALQNAFNELSKGIKDGTATADQAKTVQEALAKFAKDTGVPAIAEFAKQFDGLSKAIDTTSGKANKLNQEAAVLVDLMKSLPALGTLNPMTAQDGRFMTDAMEQQNQRAIDAANADPAILSNGRYITPPTPTARPNIELEGLPGDTKKAETAAEKAANAYRDLKKAADDRIGQVKQEIDLLSKYGIEADAARFALDLLQSSEDKGRSLSDAQRQELQRKVDLYKQYSETLAKAKLAQDLLADARYNSMTRQDQQIVTTLRQYGLSEDLNSPEAGKIRQSLRNEEFRDDVKAFASDFKNSLLNNGGDIGKAFAESIQNALLNQASKLWDDIIQKLFSGITAPGSSGGGGVGSIGGAIASAVGSAVSGKAPVGAVTRSSLPDIGATTDIASYIASAAAKRGIDPATALAVAKSEGGLKSWNLQSQFVKNGVQEPSFGPFQLYKGGGLGNDFMRKTGLDPALAVNGPAGVDFALDHAAKNGWGAWYGAAKVGVGKWDGIGGGNAADAVSKLAESAGAATKGLDTMAGGLGKIGQTLSSSFFPAAPSAPSGGGGLFGWLGGLFGGGPNLSKYQGMVGLFADGGPVNGPGTSTSDSIPTMLSDGEFVVKASASKKHRALLHAINSGRLGHMADGGLVSRSVGAPRAPSLAGRRGSANDNRGPSVLQVHISGASGDDHVRMLVKQGVGEGLSQYNVAQARGGFGTTQARFTAQKG